VILEDTQFTEFSIVDTGVDPLANSKEILDRYDFTKIVATGYGRYLAQVHLDCPVITEIKAYAFGAHYFFPECRTVIDIGGQDSKIIRISDGKVLDFEMNDRCAAGTGKFLEVMATTLGYTIDQFWREALQAEDTIAINSMCTVFAESEVITLISQGKDRQSISLGLHQSILNRIMVMMGRTGFDDEIVFAGGVAKNKCMVHLIEKRLSKQLLIPDEPQIVGAVGAALAAQSNK